MADKTKTPVPDSTSEKPKKEKRLGYNRITLSKSGKERLRFCARQKGDGPVSTYIFHSTIDADGKRARGKGRGATQSHKSFKAAKEAVDEQVAQAAKLGWILQTRKSGGGVAKDHFDLASLPKPVK